MFSLHMGLCIMLEGWPLASNSIMLNDAHPDDNTIKKRNITTNRHSKKLLVNIAW